jgi:hypothetical protein
VIEVIAAQLGPNTARTAVRTFAARALGRRPDELSSADASALLDALRPMLRTLLGEPEAARLVAEASRRLDLEAAVTVAR